MVFHSPLGMDSGMDLVEMAQVHMRIASHGQVLHPNLQEEAQHLEDKKKLLYCRVIVFLVAPLTWPSYAYT